MTEQVQETQKSLYGFDIRVPDKRRTDRNGMYDIKQLHQRSHEILGLALLGHKNTEIAEMLDISPVTVSNTINSTLGKEKLSELREGRDSEFKKQSDRITRLTTKALQVYDDIFNDTDAGNKIKKDVADTIVLELTDHRKAVKVNSQHIGVTATLDEIEEFKLRGRKAAIEAGMIPEAEIVDEPQRD